MVFLDIKLPSIREAHNFLDITDEGDVRNQGFLSMLENWYKIVGWFSTCPLRGGSVITNIFTAEPDGNMEYFRKMGKKLKV